MDWPTPITTQRNKALYLLLTLGFLCLPSLPTWAIDTATARHLLVRTGFEARWQQIERLRPLSYEQAVQHLLAQTDTSLASPAPPWVEQPLPNFRRLRMMSPEDRKALRMRFRKQARELKTWWYRQMLNTHSPITERMTLFWHNHFTSGFRKVRVPQLLYRQNQLLRNHALGNFAQLLQAISKDPAMILYLDNQSNHKRKPNENFSRELLELFTLGEGHYTEQDIKAASRAYTGWMVDPRTGRYWFNFQRHDFGTKTFMGHSDNLNGDDIIRILLKHSRTAEHITEKAWREFISETPNRAEVKRIAARFRNSGYETKVLLYEILTCPAFRNPKNHGTLIKSPVELIVGTLRQFRVNLRQHTKKLVFVGRYLGQDILDPPNVKGWPGGKSWITSGTLLARKQFLQRLLQGRNPLVMMRRDPRVSIVGDRYAPISSEHAALLTRVLLPIKPVRPLTTQTTRYAVVKHLLLDPAYQLK